MLLIVLLALAVSACSVQIQSPRAPDRSEPEPEPEPEPGSTIRLGGDSAPALRAGGASRDLLRLVYCHNDSRFDACVAARSDGGRGTARARPISCRDASGAPGVFATRLVFDAERGWTYAADDILEAPCEDGSLAVLTSAEPDAPRAAFHICDDSLTGGAACHFAAKEGGSGTAAARALSCTSDSGHGAAGLHLTYDTEAKAWSWHDVNGDSGRCRDHSVLVVATAGDAERAKQAPRLTRCEHDERRGVCGAAAINGGSGTDRVRALGCVGADTVEGFLRLPLVWKAGVWMYDGAGDGAPLRVCPHGVEVVSW